MTPPTQGLAGTDGVSATRRPMPVSTMAATSDRTVSAML